METNNQLSQPALQSGSVDYDVALCTFQSDMGGTFGPLLSVTLLSSISALSAGMYDDLDEVWE